MQGLEFAQVVQYLRKVHDHPYPSYYYNVQFDTLKLSHDLVQLVIQLEMSACTVFNSRVLNAQ